MDRRKLKDAHFYVNLMAALILVVGLGNAVLIYEKAHDNSQTVLGYEVGPDGSLYPILPGDSKKYQRGLELYGGKANVLADDLRRWFVGLWQGTNLAFTVGFITVIVSAAVFLAGRHV